MRYFQNFRESRKNCWNISRKSYHTKITFSYKNESASKKARVVEKFGWSINDSFFLQAKQLDGARLANDFGADICEMDLPWIESFGGNRVTRRIGQVRVDGVGNMNRYLRLGWTERHPGLNRTEHTKKWLHHLLPPLFPCLYKEFALIDDVTLNPLVGLGKKYNVF